MRSAGAAVGGGVVGTATFGFGFGAGAVTVTVPDRGMLSDIA